MYSMYSNLIWDIRTLLTDPDRPDRELFLSVLADERSSAALACLAPAGTFAQIAAAMSAGMPWLAAGWQRHVEGLADIVIGRRWRSKKMIATWCSMPGVVGILRNRTDDLVAQAKTKQIARWKYNHLATLAGPSDAAARLLVRAPSRWEVGQTLRRWSMANSSWQAMVVDDQHLARLSRRADPLSAFPAGVGDAGCLMDVFFISFLVISDLLAGWSPEHPSIRLRIAWIEHQSLVFIGVIPLAFLASVSGSDALAASVCARISREPSAVSGIAERVPWDRLHPLIRKCIGGDGWGAQDLDAGFSRVWHPNTPLVDLQTRTFAALLRQMDDGDVAVFTDLLSVLPPARRARFEEIIARRLDATGAGFLPA